MLFGGLVSAAILEQTDSEQELGRDSDTPYPWSVSIPDWLRLVIENRAAARGMTRSAYVRQLLIHALNTQDA